MTMTDKDICLEYSQARNPEAQVGILADLNQCSREKILEILKRGGALDMANALRTRCHYVMGEKGLTQKDLAAMMGLLKIARIAKGDSPDSFVNLAEYAACAGEIATEKPGGGV